MLPAVGAFSVISAGVIFLYLALSAFLEIFFTLPEADFEKFPNDGFKVK